MEKESLVAVAAKKSWFEARIEIFAWLGFLTFVSLMVLLVFAAVMVTCCWFRRECDREKRGAVEAGFGEAKKQSQKMVWTEKEWLAGSGWNPGKQKNDSRA